MNFFKKIITVLKKLPPSILIFLLFSAYFFIRFPYFTIDVFNYDENWHSGYMNPGFKDQIKSYQAFSPLYWIFGHLVLKTIGYFDIGFGRTFLRLLFAGFYFGSIFLIYKISKNRSNHSSAMTFLTLLFILSAPISFFGGKAITPEYLQLFLFTICLYFLSRNEKKSQKSDKSLKWKEAFLKALNSFKISYLKRFNEKYSRICEVRLMCFIWFLAGISAGLKMHALAILPFLFFYRITFLEDEIKREGFFRTSCKLAKIALPMSLLGLLVANFPIFTNYQETKQAFGNVEATSFGNIISKLNILLFHIKDPQCWEAICPFYVRNGYSHLIYDLVPPISIFCVMAIFLLSMKNRRNVVIFSLFFFSVIFIEIFIATGYANYPWYHITYVPLLLSLLLRLDIENLNKFRRYCVYTLLIMGVVCNLVTTIYSIKTAYGLRTKASELIKNNSKNTLCIDEIISQEKPNAYVFGVISLFNGKSSSFIESDFLRKKYFNSSPKNFSEGGDLEKNVINELAKNKKIKIVFSIDEASAYYNSNLYEYNSRIAFVKKSFEKEWQKNFPNREITSQVKTIKSCTGINNYALEVIIK